MKIEIIRGKNLASLEGEFCLDFTEEPLRSAGLYSISGPTGSGKSTLLDAVCLALYANTPRVEKAKERGVSLRDVSDKTVSQNDPRLILRRGTASGFAEVEFIALNGERYRARWSISRARGKVDGPLQKVSYTLYNCTRNEEEKGTFTELLKRVVELSGLTFEQFTRSVLLAQNDFATFLKAEQSSKAELLEKLTGTEIYSRISKTIYAGYVRAEERLAKVQAQIQGIEILEDEQINEINAELQKCAGRISEMEKAEKDLNSLKEEEARLNVQHKELIDSKSKTEEQLRLSREKLIALDTNVKSASAEVENLEKDFETVRPQILKARELDAQLKSVVEAKKEADKRLGDCSEKLKKGEAHLLFQKKTETEKSRLLGELYEWKEKYKSKQNIAEQYPLLVVHLESAKALSDTCAKLSAEINQKQKAEIEARKLVAANLEKKEREQQSCVAVEKRISELEDILQKNNPDELDREIKEKMSAREKLLVEQASFATTGDIKKLRENLTEGKPCPVCGSLEHPYALPAQAVKMLELASAIAGMTESISALEKRKSEYRSVEKNAADLRKKFADLQKNILEYDNKINVNTQEIKSLKESLVSLNLRISEEKAKQEEQLLKADVLFGHKEWRESWLRNASGFQKTLESFVNDWKNKTDEITKTEQALDKLKAEIKAVEVGLLPELREQEKSAAAYSKEKSLEYENRKNERNSILGGKPADNVEKGYNDRIKERRNFITALKEENTNLQKQASSAEGVLKQLGVLIIEAERKIEENKKALEKWNEEFAVNSDSVPFAEELAALRQLKGEKEFRLRKNQENLLRIAGMKNDIEKAQLDYDRWAKLNDLAGSADGAKFRRIAQSYTLDILLNYANVQLRNLSRRYRLERIPDTLALQVIDKEMFDEIRSVHSLSGGESFLVSLALALGLSSLSSNRMKVESLFIDEGFGSLDAETLSVAMDALENLRTQGRKIGVISHVREMTERIPVQIQVIRSGNGRSEVKVLTTYN